MKLLCVENRDGLAPTEVGGCAQAYRIGIELSHPSQLGLVFPLG